MNPPQVYMYSPSWTLLLPPSPYHPSGSSQRTSPKHPVSCIEPGLATRFIHDILHVSMPFCAKSFQLCLTLQLHGLWPTRLICPWAFPSQNTGVGCHTPLQGIFQTQGSNPLLFKSPPLAGKFFTTSTTWEVWVHQANCGAGWITSYSLDCWEKYQQPQIRR